jgi:3'-phosphoadenosine 5'-phosphosulfate sulfotransferase (PAPS reductase)/FAD synthetase
MDFVLDGVKYAYNKFNNEKYRIFVKITHQSMREFCLDNKMIPHPTNSACSRLMKREPMYNYFTENNLDVDLVGYVREEAQKRVLRARSYNNDQSKNKSYPITTLTDKDCEFICEREIGWIPEIYKIKNNEGKRIFKHNNCLPCKNMHDKEMKEVKKHYPGYYENALSLAKEMGQHWGRKEEIDELICPTCDWD